MATSAPFDAWMTALERRHLADLRVQEVTRALRALSSVYVERRHALSRGGALDTAGKRAAFALFYGPLHFLLAERVVTALGAADKALAAVIDLGCGTGAVGAAWALAARAGEAGSAARAGDTGATPTSAKAETPQPKVVEVRGFDRHPWAVAEASWTYGALGLPGAARRCDVTRVRLKPLPAAIALGCTVNELEEDVRGPLLKRLLAAAREGASVLVIEPIARPAGSWWDQWTAAFVESGGREDTWRFDADLPDVVRTLDRAAGLDHRVLTGRTLYLATDGPKSGVRRPKSEATAESPKPRAVIP